MVLRRFESIVYGYAPQGNHLVLSFVSNEEETKYEVVRSTRHVNLWTVNIPEMPHGGSYQIILKHQHEQISLYNVTFGEVVFCASNVREIGVDNVMNINTKDVRVHVVAPNPEPNTQIATKMDPQPNWMSVDTLGKISIGLLARICASSRRGDPETPVGVIVSRYPDSELEAWYPVLDQLTCDEENIRCVGRTPHVLLTKSNYVSCSQRPRERLDLFWSPGNAQLFNGMVRPYALTLIDGILFYTNKNQVQGMSCSLDHLSKSWIRSWNFDSNEQRIPFLCLLNDETNRNIEFRVLPSVRHGRNTLFSTSSSLSSRIKKLMTLEPE